MAKADLTAQRLRELLDYAPETGIFTRKVKRAKFQCGEVAGVFTKLRYIRIGVDGKSYYGQRLAWLFMTGAWPDDEVDHINGDPSDNRWVNLRAADRWMNTQNQRRAHKDNPVGIQGVSYVKKKGVFRASLTVNKKARCLGYFDTPEKAHEKYVEEKRKHHPGCVI